MNIIHIMKDGTALQSVEGIVIRSKQFYQVLNEIQKREQKKGKKYEI